MLSAKVSTKNQISLPSEARRKLGIQPGDRLSVQVRDDELVLRRRPARASDRLRGLARGSYAPDPDTYLRRLRDEMEANLSEGPAMVDPQLDREPSADRP